jgi:hypothetical protein
MRNTTKHISYDNKSLARIQTKDLPNSRVDQSAYWVYIELIDSGLQVKSFGSSGQYHASTSL